MKKRVFFTALLSFLSVFAIAQTTELEESLRKQTADTTEGWKKGGGISINFSQASFTNWAAGGENSISGVGLVNLYANYLKGKNSWDNNLEIGYGLLKQGDENDLRKTDDKIDITSKYGRKFSKSLYYSALANFRTQFAPGYNYPDDSNKISEFLAPAYLLAGIGVDYMPSEHFTLYLSPLTYKLIIVNNRDLADAGAFGVDPAEYDDFGNITKNGEKSKSKFGAYLRTIFKHDIMENILFQTKLELYSNYLKNPQNIDINWENLIAMSVNKFISVDITTQLIYDDNVMILVDKDTGKVGPRTQFKETLMIGLTYKF